MLLLSFRDLLLALLALTGSIASVISQQQHQHNVHNVPNPSPLVDANGPNLFSIKFFTNAALEPFVVNVTRAWAPKGADRMYALVKDNYFTNCTFFRVVPDFILQFGIAAEPIESDKWNTNMKDDPVVVTNAQWTLSFATSGSNTRSTQLFINYEDNGSLDFQGFSPFGQVISGHDTLLAVTNPTPGKSRGINQDNIYRYGTDWVLKTYPTTSYIRYATIVFEDEINTDFDQSGGSPGSSKVTMAITVSIVIILTVLLFCVFICFKRRYSKPHLHTHAPLQQEEAKGDDEEEEEDTNKLYEMTKM